MSNDEILYYSNKQTNITTVQVTRFNNDTKEEIKENYEYAKPEINLSWSEIQVKTKLNSFKCLINKVKNRVVYNEKIIINNLNGIIKSGEMLALMGAR